MSFVRFFLYFVGDDEGNIKDEVKQESVKAGNEISTEFEQALMKLF